MQMCHNLLCLSAALGWNGSVPSVPKRQWAQTERQEDLPKHRETFFLLLFFFFSSSFFYCQDNLSLPQVTREVVESLAMFKSHQDKVQGNQLYGTLDDLRYQNS